MSCSNFQNNSFRKHLLMAPKWMLSSLSNRAMFYWECFYLKNHPKNTYLHSHFHEEREFHHCFSSCFHHYFLCFLSSKTLFFLAKHKDFDFFKATLSTLNIIYIKLIYIKSSFEFTFE